MEIHFLLNDTAAKIRYEVTIGESGSLVFEKLDHSVNPRDCNIYFCPECYEDLFEDDSEAEKFLKGESVEVVK